MDASSPREPLGLLNMNVPLLCKVLLTTRLLNCEPFRGHCSDLNISNMDPKDLSFRTDEIFPIFINFIKDLSFRTDEIFPIFINFITPKHKRHR